MVVGVEEDPVGEEEEDGEPEAFPVLVGFTDHRWPLLTELTTPATILGGRTMIPTTTPGTGEPRLPANLPVGDPGAEAEVAAALTKTREEETL